jgi:tetratricopeptide (TPR) repeat protein
VVESEINNLFRGKIDKLKISPDAFLLNFNYNLLFYWKFGSENNWTKAYKYALKNYKLLEENHEKINQFPEFTIHILYNLLNVASFTGKEIYRVALKKLKATILSIQNKRIKLDGLLYLHLSNLIHLNRNKPKLLESKSVEDAEKFIERNKQNFSHIRLNHFYFDLAKSYYYRNDFKKSFSILNEMYQNFYSKDYTIDFNTHSRFLYCLVCYELGEYELLRSTAKSIKDFMERNGILFKFEKRMIRFIMNDLPILLEKPVETRRKKIEKLKSDITLILESNYEKKVLNYFDYYFWIDSQAVRFNK